MCLVFSDVTAKHVSRSCLAVLLFWFLGLRWGRAVFLGARGRVWIAPAVTPASHLPSSAHLFRRCRSNQSSADCLTVIVVIRPMPVFLSLRVFPQAFTLPLSPRARFPRPLSWFSHASIYVHGWIPLISLFRLPASSPCCRLRNLAPQPAPNPPTLDSL